MTKEQFAEMLNGRQYRNEITLKEGEIAKYNGLVVIFGASDDLIEFRGVIYDEIGALDGCEFAIATPGTEIKCTDEDKYYRAKKLEIVELEHGKQVAENKFKALWSPDELDCSWLIKTTIPNASFDILEDGELYCRGVVIDIKDLQ